MAQPFNVMAVFWLARDRLYRVYADADGLYFIRIGGQFAYKDIAANPHGGLAYAVQATLAAAERILPPDKIAAYDRTPPRQVLGQHEHDLAVPFANIASSSLVPPSLISLHGRNLGRWLLNLQEGGRWMFQFMELDQLKVAFEVLPPLLGDRLQVKVRWDEAREKFVANT